MPVSMLSEAEFINLVMMKWVDFFNMVLRHKTPRGMMELRRQMQIACVAFAKGKPRLTMTNDGTPLNLRLLSHVVQERWIAFNNGIEKVARGLYFQQMIPKIMRVYPESMKRPGDSEKKAQMKWDRFLKKFGYTQKSKTLAKRDWERLQKSLSY
jgi:hypothetical protein